MSNVKIHLTRGLRKYLLHFLHRIVSSLPIQSPDLVTLNQSCLLRTYKEYLVYTKLPFLTDMPWWIQNKFSWQIHTRMGLSSFDSQWIFQFLHRLLVDPNGMSSLDVHSLGTTIPFLTFVWWFHGDPLPSDTWVLTFRDYGVTTINLQTTVNSRRRGKLEPPSAVFRVICSVQSFIFSRSTLSLSFSVWRKDDGKSIQRSH